MAEPAIHRGSCPRGVAAFEATTRIERVIASMVSRRQSRLATTPCDGRAN